MSLVMIKALVARLGILVVGTTLVVGCTTYHAAGPSGGFSETKLSTTSYQVFFRGNGYTSPARVEKFMLRRAAELALENGYRYFKLDAPQNLDRRDFIAMYSERGVNSTRRVHPARPSLAPEFV